MKENIDKLDFEDLDLEEKKWVEKRLTLKY